MSTVRLEMPADEFFRLVEDAAHYRSTMADSESSYSAQAPESHEEPAAEKLTQAKKYPKPAPKVTLAVLRQVAGLTIDELTARIEEKTGYQYTRGAISAVENGHRGAGRLLIEGLAAAYGIDPDEIQVGYRPRHTPVAAPGVGKQEAGAA